MSSSPRANDGHDTLFYLGDLADSAFYGQQPDDPRCTLAFRSLGVAIRDDVSLIGFDDFNLPRGDAFNSNN